MTPELIVHGMLGKLKPKVKAKTLKLAKYLVSLPQLPTQFDWTGKVKSWGMMKNDTVGDCTCAAAGHMILSWTEDNGNGLIPTDDDIISAYAAITGYDPKTGEGDNGAAELDVLDYWRKTGIAGRKIGGYASVTPSDIPHIKFSIWAFGGIYLGANMPLAWQNEAIWTKPVNMNDPSAAPGSWGGHAFCGTGYDEQGVIVITWGQALKITWDAFITYLEEAYCIWSTDFINGDKPAPSGFDQNTLRADFSAVTN